jgi:hypothetical protein
VPLLKEFLDNYNAMYLYNFSTETNPAILNKIWLQNFAAWEHHVPLAFHSGREADHSPPSSAEVKEWVELYLHSPNTLSCRGAQLGGTHDVLISLMVFNIPTQMSIVSDCIHHRKT